MYKVRTLVIVLLLVAQAATAQMSSGYNKILNRVSSMAKTLPKDIYEANKRYPNKWGATAFDTIKRWVEAEVTLMAEKIEYKHAAINESAGMRYKGGSGYEPVNEELNALLMEGYAEEGKLRDEVLPALHYYRGGYQSGYLKVQDSLYKARRELLEPYVIGMLALVDREQQYLVEHADMLESKKEAERMQYHEAVWKCLLKLSAINYIMSEIVKPASGAVAFCKQYPVDCKKMEKR